MHHALLCSDALAGPLLCVIACSSAPVVCLMLGRESGQTRAGEGGGRCGCRCCRWRRREPHGGRCPRCCSLPHRCHCCGDCSHCSSRRQGARQAARGVGRQAEAAEAAEATATTAARAKAGWETAAAAAAGAARGREAARQGEATASHCHGTASAVCDDFARRRFISARSLGLQANLFSHLAVREQSSPTSAIAINQYVRRAANSAWKRDGVLDGLSVCRVFCAGPLASGDCEAGAAHEARRDCRERQPLRAHAVGVL